MDKRGNDYGGAFYGRVTSLLESHRYDLVAMCGRIDSGKDTFARMITEEPVLRCTCKEPKRYTFVRDSFANQLKDDVAEKKGWNRALLEGDTPEGKHWRETFVDPETGLTPRQVLQEYGMACRRIFGDDMWVNIVKKRACGERIYRNISTLVTDCRFFNEQKMILDNNGIVFVIKRHEDDFIVRPGEHESENSFWQILDNPEYKDRVVLLDNTEDGGLEKVLAQIVAKLL